MSCHFIFLIQAVLTQVVFTRHIYNFLRKCALKPLPFHTPGGCREYGELVWYPEVPHTQGFRKYLKTKYEKVTDLAWNYLQLWISRGNWSFSETSRMFGRFIGKSGMYWRIIGTSQRSWTSYQHRLGIWMLYRSLLNTFERFISWIIGRLIRMGGEFVTYKYVTTNSQP